MPKAAVRGRKNGKVAVPEKPIIHNLPFVTLSWQEIDFLLAVLNGSQINVQGSFNRQRFAALEGKMMKFHEENKPKAAAGSPKKEG